ncbi:MAG: copper resistance protein B [Bdellovibrionales bacterium]|nr:copper resistance protein B [Bdellovibrionales bacterium]
MSHRELLLLILAAVLLGWCSSVHAQSGTWNQAEAYYGKSEMQHAKKHVQKMHGGMPLWYAQADRLEYRLSDDSQSVLWDAEGWYGGDTNKLWVKTEGNYLLDDEVLDDAEGQLLISHAVTPFLDLQAGVRRAFEPDPARTYAVVGLEGLVPYEVEVDAAAFLSNEKELTARMEGEFDLLLTQRLILQPRAELQASAQDIPELGLGFGINEIEAGIRMRYEFIREVAPYVGVSWSRLLGETAHLAENGIEQVVVLAGIRLWW